MGKISKGTDADTPFPSLLEEGLDISSRLHAEMKSMRCYVQYFGHALKLDPSIVGKGI